MTKQLNISYTMTTQRLSGRNSHLFKMSEAPYDLFLPVKKQHLWVHTIRTRGCTNDDRRSRRRRDDGHSPHAALSGPVQPRPAARRRDQQSCYRCCFPDLPHLAFICCHCTKTAVLGKRNMIFFYFPFFSVGLSAKFISRAIYSTCR